jgi:hypothetical protein
MAFEDSSRKPPIGETARLTNRSEGFQHWLNGTGAFAMEGTG